MYIELLWESSGKWLESWSTSKSQLYGQKGVILYLIFDLNFWLPVDICICMTSDCYRRTKFANLCKTLLELHLLSSLRKVHQSQVTIKSIISIVYSCLAKMLHIWCLLIICKLSFKCSKICLLQTPIDCEKQSLLLGLRIAPLDPDSEYTAWCHSSLNLWPDIQRLPSQANHCPNKQLT